MSDSWASLLMIYVLDSLTSFTVLAVYIFAVLDEKIKWKIMGKFMLTAAVPSAVFYDMLLLLSDLNPLVIYAVSSVLTLALATLSVSYLWKRDVWRAFCVVGVAAVMQVSTGAVIGSVLQNITLKELSDFLLFVQQIFLLYPMTAFGISILLKKIHFGRPICHLLEHSRNIRMTALEILGMEILAEIFFTMRLGMQEESLITYNAAVIVLTFLLMGILMYLSDKEASERKIRLQESMILQQRMYVESLEDLQRDMRAFRHDYKNMLSCMYLSVSEGEVEKIRHTLKSFEFEFDQKLGERIRMTTQIGNIWITEVKSLVLSKLMEMNEKKIDCRVEVMYPVTETGIDIWDFNRCLGILLDNAIEASADIPDSGIELILSSRDGFLTVRVANTWRGDADIGRIWKEGYSSKGDHRGIGLASYQRIIEKYPQAMPATSWTEGLFVQELTIEV